MSNGQLQLAGKTFLLTGAYGFIGAWIVKRLVGCGNRPVILDLANDAQRLRMIMDEEEIAQTTFINGDVTDPSAVLQAIEKSHVTHLIHLAGLQVPICRADPHRGATVNVLGTINVFEAVRKVSPQISSIVYASSAAVFGNGEASHPISERDAPLPSSHYGVFKRCNEGNAHVYYLDHGINSVGLRPLTVYGVGRDFGLTSDPTKAMKAAVIGRPFKIRFGGKTDFQYVADTAECFIRAAASPIDGAHVFNLHGETVHISQIVKEIERALPESRGSITHADEPLPIPAEFDDAAIRKVLGDVPSTPLQIGVEETINRFRELDREERLSTADLDQ